jgi:hypothetical protein
VLEISMVEPRKRVQSVLRHWRFSLLRNNKQSIQIVKNLNCIQSLSLSGSLKTLITIRYLSVLKSAATIMPKAMFSHRQSMNHVMHGLSSESSGPFIILEMRQNPNTLKMRRSVHNRTKRNYWPLSMELLILNCLSDDFSTDPNSHQLRGRSARQISRVLTRIFPKSSKRSEARVEIPVSQTWSVDNTDSQDRVLDRFWMVITDLCGWNNCEDSQKILDQIKTKSPMV